MSVRMKILIKCFQIYVKLNRGSKTLEENMDKIVQNQELNLKMSALKGLYVTRGKIEGREIVRIKREHTQKKECLIYLFGGGFIAYPTKFDLIFIKALLKKYDCEVILPIYPLRPKHTLAEIVSFTNKVYEDVLKEYDSQKISFLGFSSGASLIMYLFNYRKMKEMEAIYPRLVILSSPMGQYPFLDSTMQKMKKIEPHDPIFNIGFIEELVAFVDDPQEPGLISITDHDFSGFPTIKLSYGERELFAAFVDEYKEAQEKYGLDLKLMMGKGCPHCYPLLQFTPEGKEALEEIVGFLKE